MVCLSRYPLVEGLLVLWEHVLFPQLWELFMSCSPHVRGAFLISQRLHQICRMVTQTTFAIP
jgi:hypothetical protein